MTTQEALSICHKHYLEPPDINISVVCKCEICDRDIFDGDDCYQIMDDTWCEDCISDARKVAEIPEYDPYDERVEVY